ncbi:MAG: transglycosylase SLT domain-containing protein [Bacteroidota bacterium]
MRSFLCKIFLFLVISSPLYSQNPVEADSLDDEPILNLLDSFLVDYNFDYPGLRDNDRRKKAAPKQIRPSRDQRNIFAPPAVVAQRLAEIPAVIPMDYNEYVQRYIDVYTKEKREQVRRMLGLQETYFPIFEAELDRARMPMELKYLPIVESALNPHARSRVGATGLWQFMYYTARDYRLEINSYVDERKDPFASTEAAVRYLQLAYNEFGDWLLAIAAYNCGEGNVRKAIRRSGGGRTFWEIRRYLPRETRGYVPAFIAATYVFNYHADHNLFPVEADFSYYQDTLHLRKIDITLEEIARMSRTDAEELRNLNPHLKLGRIPYSSHPFVLRVSPEVGQFFAANEREIRAKYGKKRDNAPVYAANYSVKRPKPAPRKAYPKPPGTVTVYYTVRTGDVVGTIAEKYEVSTRNLARWNNLYRYRIKVGQKLKIYTKKEVAQRNATPQLASTSRSKSTSSPGPQSGQFYKVKRGDTLWDIAKKYTQGNVDDLLALNSGLTASASLRIGQSIRVR